MYTFQKPVHVMVALLGHHLPDRTLVHLINNSADDAIVRDALHILGERKSKVAIHFAEQALLGGCRSMHIEAALYLAELENMEMIHVLTGMLESDEYLISPSMRRIIQRSIEDLKMQRADEDI